MRSHFKIYALSVFLRAEEVKEESISFQIQRRNWQAQASIALLKLTLRALAGHIRSGQSEGRTISVLFSVPAIEPLNPSFSSSSVSASMLDFEATPIYFQSAVDVPALWIESIKTFCDVATSNVSSSSSFHRHAKVNQTPLCIKVSVHFSVLIPNILP